MIPSEDYEWFLIEGINPEPWQAPNMSTGRRNGKVFPMANKNPGLMAYQEAVQEALHYEYPEVELFTGKVELIMFFWRQLPIYQGDRGKVRKHEADATNMQKALEDALQGILLDNDRNVVSIQSHIVEQAYDTDAAILIGRSLPKTDLAFADEVRRSIGTARSQRKHPSGSHREHSVTSGFITFDDEIDFDPKSIF